jgi:UDP-N-acetylglucosamine 2-epimerase (non-hydrolysing)
VKNITTITGIRPDFIRMSKIFKKLDENFNHTLIHTGQHFDDELSGVFFKDLNIREPDVNFGLGQSGGDHIIQLQNLAVAIDNNRSIIENSDLVLFLGDSNSALGSVIVKKMGVKVGHIEAGMRSGDKRMLEEINRTVCDHCSDILFPYHYNYKEKLYNEGIGRNAYVVGNTITEVVKDFIPTEPKREDVVYLDIHRPENFLYRNRLQNIIRYASTIGWKLNKPVKMLRFPRTHSKIQEYGIEVPDNVSEIDLMGFRDYINSVYHAVLLISDSGTAQEEPALLRTPVAVPRDYTERPESYEYGCSFQLNVEEFYVDEVNFALSKMKDLKFNTEWLGEGNTSDLVIKHIKEFLND